MTTIQALEPGEFEQLLEEQLAARYNPLRDSLALCLLHDTAGRVSEVCGLEPDDVSDDQATLRIWAGKGRSENEYDSVPISDRTKRILNLYLEEERVPGNTLLTTGTGQPLQDSHYRRLLRRLGQRVLGKHVWPHLLRHTQLTDMACGTPGRSALPLPLVKELGRHRNIATTQKYIHVRPGWGDEFRRWMAG